MKKLLTFTSITLLALTTLCAQDTDSKGKKDKKPGIGIGIKGGLNFANVTNAKSINGSSRTGFMVGIFLAPPSKKIISSHTELIFSRQGYNFKTASSTGSVDLNYLILPQLMGINITRFVQLQVGFQTAILLNAKADSTAAPSQNNPYASLTSYYNRFDYGVGGGIEIFPFKGLLIGARYNHSFGDVFKQPSTDADGNMTPPSFAIDKNAKNNVVQLYLGWRF